MRHLTVKVMIALSSFALVAFVAACGSDDDGGSGDSKRIAAVLYGREVPYYAAVGDGIKQQAEEYGWEVNVNYTDPDPAAEVDAVTTALGTGVDGLVVVPIDREALVPAGKDALDQDVPFVVVGDDLADPAARTSFVGGDFVDFGRQKAEFIVEQLGGKGKVGIVHGVRGISFTEDQNDGATEVFSKSPGIEVVDGPYAGNFTADLGLQATENLLTANPDLDAIFFDNDDLALGGAQAIQDRGLDPNKILVVGTDGLEAGRAGLAAGDIDFTVVQCAVDEGREAVRALNEQFENGEVEARIVTPVYPVTPDTLEQFETEHKECIE